MHYICLCRRAAQKVMPHIFFLGNYLLRMYEIHAQCNWLFPLHMWFFHIISIYVYGLTPARNKGMPAFPVPVRFLFTNQALIIFKPCPTQCVLQWPQKIKIFWAKGVASSAVTKKKVVQDNSFCRKGHHHRLLVTLMEWFWWMWWPEVRQSIRTHTSEPSKNWNSITSECGLTGIQETCWFSTTVSALTQVYEPRRQLPNLVGMCFPIHPIVLIWHRQIFIFLSYWRMHCVGQGLKMTRAWFVQWRHGYVNRKRAGTGKARMPLFRAGVRP